MRSSEERFGGPRLAGVELRAVHWGRDDARPLVLLHGAGANAHWWDHLAPAWADRFHVVALDFRGHGDSDRPEEKKPGAFSDDLAALLEHLGAPTAPIVGHSLGAHVALEHASRTGDPAALVLVDPSRGASPRRRRATRLALGVRRSFATRDEAEASFRFLPPAPAASEELRAAIATRSVERLPDGRFGVKFDAGWLGVPSRGRPDPARVLCPTLLIRGAESRLLTHEGARELVGELPDGRLVEIEGAGHHVQLDRPAETGAAIRAFLDEVLPG